MNWQFPVKTIDRLRFFRIIPAMKSMTGYGRGECSQDGLKITTEVSSVNRKQTEINVYLPRELDSLELQVRDEVNRRIARGRLTVKVALHAGESYYGGKVQLNVSLAKAYAKEIAKLGREEIEMLLS